MPDYWQWMNCAWDLLFTSQAGAAAVKARSQRRLVDLVRFARQHSRFYRQHYGRLPPDTTDLHQLPPVTKRGLMAHFDDWVTDPAVTRAAVEAFVADLTRVGHPYLGRYAVWTSSGTTGEPGLFVHDSNALTVYDALLAMRFGRAAPAAQSPPGMIGWGDRYAMVGATGGHFAGFASVERLRFINPFLARTVRVFSILQPIPDLVRALNEFQPSCLATYPTAMTVLVQEQESGRLQIHPSAVWTGGEWLSPALRDEIKRIFRCQAQDDYGASEFMSIACGCGRGWLHVNADWVILEPVDAHGHPVPAGEPSHTVLLTNLANRAQPLIRYDLGDSITVHSEPCRCGSFLPAIRVEGRRDEILALRTPDGRTVQLLPLALSTVIEEEAHVHRFQIIQTGPETLKVRLEVPAGADARAAWHHVKRCLQGYLTAHGLHDAVVKHDPAPLKQDPLSGKFRQVIAAVAR